MGRRQAVNLLTLVLVFIGIGGLAAHRFAPDRLLASLVIGCVFGIALYAWLTLLQWRECKGDGTCVNCPKQARMSRLQRFCGNHPRITLARRLAFVAMGICLAATGYIYAHIIGVAAGIVALQIISAFKVIGIKLLHLLH